MWSRSCQEQRYGTAPMEILGQNPQTFGVTLSTDWITQTDGCQEQNVTMATRIATTSLHREEVKVELKVGRVTTRGRRYHQNYARK